MAPLVTAAPSEPVNHLRSDLAIGPFPRGLIADNLAHDQFSEHGQCLALLTDTLAREGQGSRCFDSC